jgi:hypothetical protein
LVQALKKCVLKVRELPARSDAHKTNHRHRWLLRARRERPRSHRTAKQPDEFPALHENSPAYEEHATLPRSRR